MAEKSDGDARALFNPSPAVWPSICINQHNLHQPNHSRKAATSICIPAKTFDNRSGLMS